MTVPMLTWQLNFDDVADQLANRGYAVCPKALDESSLTALQAYAAHLAQSGRLRAAGTGRDRMLGTLRQDNIHWIEDTNDNATEAAAHEAIEQLRVVLNQRLYLGAESIEAHFAHYPPGGGYARHLDRMQHDDARVLSLVLYLNAAWHAREGGQLRLWIDEATTLDVLPEGGTLVLFRSEQFWHQVLPSTRDRLSIAGWFRRRSVRN